MVISLFNTATGGPDNDDKDATPAATSPTKASATPTEKASPKPKKKVATPEQKVRKAIKETLGKSNRDVKRLESLVYNDDAGLGAIVIRWAINDNLTEGLTKKSAKLDIAEMLEEIQGLQEDGLNVEQVTFSGTFPLVDKFGDTKELKVVNATYSGATVRKINFDNFLNKNVYEIADEATIHPAFED